MSEAESNRAGMPLTAALVDQFRSVFGGDVRCVFTTEGGQVRGSPGPQTTPLPEDLAHAMRQPVENAYSRKRR